MHPNKVIKQSRKHCSGCSVHFQRPSLTLTGQGVTSHPSPVGSLPRFLCVCMCVCTQPEECSVRPNTGQTAGGPRASLQHPGAPWTERCPSTQTMGVGGGSLELSAKAGRASMWGGLQGVSTQPRKWSLDTPSWPDARESPEAWPPCLSPSFRNTVSSELCSPDSPMLLTSMFLHCSYFYVDTLSI